MGKSSKKLRVFKNRCKKILQKILLSNYFRVVVKASIFVIIFSSVLYIAYGMINKKVSENVIVSKSEIIQMVSKKVSLPKEEPKVVVRVSDADALKNQNPFFKDIKSGNYVLVYENLAIIYDLRNDRVVGIKEK